MFLVLLLSIFYPQQGVNHFPYICCHGITEWPVCCCSFLVFLHVNASLKTLKIFRGILSILYVLSLSVAPSPWPWAINHYLARLHHAECFSEIMSLQQVNISYTPPHCLQLEIEDPCWLRSDSSDVRLLWADAVIGLVLVAMLSSFFSVFMSGIHHS